MIRKAFVWVERNFKLVSSMLATSTFTASMTSFILNLSHFLLYFQTLKPTNHQFCHQNLMSLWRNDFLSINTERVIRIRPHRPHPHLQLVSPPCTMLQKLQKCEVKAHSLEKQELNWHPILCEINFGRIWISENAIFLHFEFL